MVNAVDVLTATIRTLRSDLANARSAGESYRRQRDAEVRRGRALRETVEGLAAALDLEAHDDDASRAVTKWESADRLRKLLAAVDGEQ